MIYVLTEWNGKGSGDVSLTTTDKAQAMNSRECVLSYKEAKDKYGSDYFRQNDVKCTSLYVYASEKKHREGDSKKLITGINMIGSIIKFETPSETIQGQMLTKIGAVIDKVCLSHPVTQGGNIFVLQGDFYLAMDKDSKIFTVSCGAVKELISYNGSGFDILEKFNLYTNSQEKA